jgi:glycosyltransferase involved in cell wall biosynthesis
VGKMAFVELYLLKLFGVKIYVQYQGDDARQGDYSVSNYLINFAKFLPESYYNKKSDDLKRKRIKLIDGVAEKIYALNPDLMNVLPSRAEFLPYSHIDLKDWGPVYNKIEGRPLRVGHAPSNRLVKGTDFIVNAIDKLKQEGYSIDFVLVEGLENKAAKEIYIGLDIVIDQLLAGWYGGLAVEVMALGKPVITYIRDGDLRHIPEQMKNDLPIINASTSTIYDVLKSVLLMPKMELYEIARKSRAYVERWHDSDRIAARIKRDMEITLGRVD